MKLLIFNFFLITNIKLIIITQNSKSNLDNQPLIKVFAHLLLSISGFFDTI